MGKAKVFVDIPTWQKVFSSPVIVDQWIYALLFPFPYSIEQITYVTNKNHFEVTIVSDLIPVYAGEQAEVIPFYHKFAHGYEVERVLFRNTPESEEEYLYPEDTNDLKRAKALLWEEIGSSFSGACFRPTSLSNAIDAFAAVVQRETLNTYIHQRDKK